jgi:uncharacterized protein YigE (DUF2233 family)
VTLPATFLILLISQCFALSERSFKGHDYVTADFDLKKTDVKLYWQREDKKPYETLTGLRSSLKAEGKKLLMATNSGIYDKDYRPLGLHIERGKKLRGVNHSKAPGGNFSMVPNGIFLILKAATGPQARVIETSEFESIKESDVQDATQSGPILVHKGSYHPLFTKGSQNKKLRSGVGVDEKGQVWFAISKGFVSFYEFAEFFKEALGCPNALYLDGSISEMIGEFKTTDGPSEQLTPFVGIWAATQP